MVSRVRLRLLAALLALAAAGRAVTLLERGRPVEGRGRDIGALMVRRVLNPESNLCYGEGGAGTWSDGKLTTKLGRNGVAVRAVRRVPSALRRGCIALCSLLQDLPGFAEPPDRFDLCGRPRPVPCALCRSCGTLLLGCGEVCITDL